jgi:hypothetical protein
MLSTGLHLTSESTGLNVQHAAVASVLHQLQPRNLNPHIAKATFICRIAKPTQHPRLRPR